MRASTLVALALLASGCGTPIPSEELPTELLAFVRQEPHQGLEGCFAKLKFQLRLVFCLLQRAEQLIG